MVPAALRTVPRHTGHHWGSASLRPERCRSSLAEASHFWFHRMQGIEGLESWIRREEVKGLLLPGSLASGCDVSHIAGSLEEDEARGEKVP